MIYVDGLKLLDESDKQPQWNLLTGTADFSGDNWVFNQTVIEKTEKASNGNSVATEQPWSQPFQFSDFIEGRYYTFSIDVKESHAQIMVQDSDGTNSSNVDQNIKKFDFDNSNWHRVSMTFKCLKSFKGRAFEASDTSHEVANMKLEYGTVATSWMPAITDLALKSRLGDKA